MLGQDEYWVKFVGQGVGQSSRSFSYCRFVP